MNSLLAMRIPPRAAAAVLALALLATVVSGREKRDLAREPEPAARLAQPVAVPDLDLGRLKRPQPDGPVADLFAPPPLPAGAPAASPEVAPPAGPPPLPFRYLAKIVDGGQTSVFLLNGEDHYQASPGQVIGRDYRVERITETAITFTYLPLGARQSLPVPALN